jgi:hypothetical protein
MLGTSKTRFGGDHIYPTGTCFEDISQHFIRSCLSDKSLLIRDFYMVHGICLMLDGARYSHAWIEDRNEAIFSGRLDAKLQYFKEPIYQFNLRFRVQERTRYTFMEAMKTARTHRDAPPPWEDKYRRLCKGYKLKKLGK